MFQTKEHNLSAHITVNRNRIKNYDENVYLKDGTYFEIELFNPLKVKVLVVISIDGKHISESGVILNPGQRVYLERWIERPQKLLFSTYHVENSEEVKEAISENGKVVIAFHEETIKNFYPSGTWRGSVITNTDHPYQYDYAYRLNDSELPFGGTTVNTMTSWVMTNSLETGKIEMGEKSSQSFNESHGDFNAYPSRIIEWQILPETMKPVEISKIRSYCTNCGIRVRASSWKFCPSCGEKL